MATLERAVVTWTGFNGGPGYSVMYATPGGSVLQQWRNLLAGVAFLFPTGTQIAFPPAGDTIDSVTGALTGTWTYGPISSVTGTGSGSYAAGVGGCVEWRTAGIVDGRRVRGRTFLVPFSGNIYDAGGSLQDANVTAMNGYLVEFLDAVDEHLVVWNRPRKASPGVQWERPPVTARPGSHHVVTSALIKDRVSTLRTRRY